VAGDGSNAIMAGYDMIRALQELEAEWNDRAAADPVCGDVPHPLNFNAGKIAGGDWASSVPAWCDIDFPPNGSKPPASSRSALANLSLIFSPEF
jgi:acetylornithine deacetylase